MHPVFASGFPNRSADSEHGQYLGQSGELLSVDLLRLTDSSRRAKIFAVLLPTLRSEREVSWAIHAAGELGDDFPNHPALNIGQTEIPSIMAVGQLLVIHAQQVKNGRVQIVNIDPIFGRLVSKFISCPMTDSSLGATTGEPVGEGMRIVIPSRFG